jgi:ABC-type dipeptide/oligopeptide/nickel transport system ATPase component
VGESGSGKSVTSLAIMRLIPNPPGKISAGHVIFDGQDLVTLPEAKMRKIRGKKISMIFQEPMTSSNPVFTVGDQIAETLVLHEGLYYTCVLTGGTNPRSGDIEPEWPTEEGAQVVEYADGEAEEALPAPPEPPSNNTPSEPYRERYGRGELER